VAARTTGGLRCGPQPDAAARAAGSAERAPRSGAHAARLVNCTFNAIIAMLQQRHVHRRRHAIAAVHHRLHRPPAPSFCGPSYPRKSHIPHSPKLPAQRLPRVAPPRGKNRSPSRLHHLDRTGKRVHEPSPRRRAKFTSEKASHRYVSTYLRRGALCRSPTADFPAPATWRHPTSQGQNARWTL